MGEVFKRARMTTPCVIVLEDLDSMIDDNNRAFFLNELDGFHSNTGMVVLASTNHPEKLDSSILDRPSRFDRKYYFQLPADVERRAYVASWNCELQREMHITEKASARLVSETQDFSFAYLKELLVSSMVQWVSLGGSQSMDEVIVAQTDLLRKQISDSSRK
jgi:AAA+ superfamily predicted ATPase